MADQSALRGARVYLLAFSLLCIACAISTVSWFRPFTVIGQDANWTKAFVVSAAQALSALFFFHLLRRLAKRDLWAILGVIWAVTNAFTTRVYAEPSLAIPAGMFFLTLALHRLASRAWRIEHIIGIVGFLVVSVWTVRAHDWSVLFTQAATWSAIAIFWYSPARARLAVRSREAQWLILLAVTFVILPFVPNIPAFWRILLIVWTYAVMLYISPVAEQSTQRAPTDEVAPVRAAIRVRAREAAAVLVIMLSLAFSLRYEYGNPDYPPYWNGAVHKNVIEQYIAKGYRLDAVRADELPAYARGQPSAAFTHRVLYTVVVAGLQRVTGWPLDRCIQVVLIVGYGLTAWLLFLITVSIAATSIAGGVFAGASFLLLSPTILMYLVKAHPEPLLTLFTAAAFLFFHKRRDLAGGFALLLALLSKEPALVLSLMITATLLREAWRSRNLSVLRRLIPYVAATFLALAIPRILVGGSPEQVMFTGPFMISIAEYTYHNVFPFLLAHFELLWIPFALATICYRKSQARPILLDRGELFFLFAILFGLLVTAIDWWRIWFAPAFIWIIPIAVIYLDDLFDETVGHRGRWVAYGLVLLLLFKRQYNSAIMGASLVNYLLFFFFLAVCERKRVAGAILPQAVR